jgi:hypothetical protein
MLLWLEYSSYTSQSQADNDNGDYSTDRTARILGRNWLSLFIVRRYRTITLIRRKLAILLRHLENRQRGC